MSIISVYITYPDLGTAQAIVSQLLNEKLIACGNIFPISSHYVWQDTIENENEYVSLVKTSPKLWDTLVEFVESKHPYEIPCIVKYEVEANKSYTNWVLKNVHSQQQDHE